MLNNKRGEYSLEKSPESFVYVLLVTVSLAMVFTRFIFQHSVGDFNAVFQKLPLGSHFLTLVIKYTTTHFHQTTQRFQKPLGLSEVVLFMLKKQLATGHYSL